MCSRFYFNIKMVSSKKNRNQLNKNNEMLTPCKKNAGKSILAKSSGISPFVFYLLNSLLKQSLYNIAS